MIPRDYQRAAVAAARARTTAHGNTLVALPVGAGKTAVRAVTQLDPRSVPQPEGEAGRNPLKHPPQYPRGPPGAGVASSDAAVHPGGRLDLGIGALLFFVRCRVIRATADQQKGRQNENRQNGPRH